MRISDWSSDVCSSDLYIALHGYVAAHAFIVPGLGPGQNSLQDAPVIQMIGQRPPIASQLELTIGQSVLFQLVSGLRQHVIMSRLDNQGMKPSAKARIFLGVAVLHRHLRGSVRI